MTEPVPADKPVKPPPDPPVVTPDAPDPNPHGYWQGPPEPITSWFHLGMQPQDLKH